MHSFKNPSNPRISFYTLQTRDNWKDQENNFGQLFLQVYFIISSKSFIVLFHHSINQNQSTKAWNFINNRVTRKFLQNILNHRIALIRTPDSGLWGFWLQFPSQRLADFTSNHPCDCRPAWQSGLTNDKVLEESYQHWQQLQHLLLIIHCGRHRYIRHIK